jgi:Mn2+/Fe2+ NRAMP family transporter
MTPTEYSETEALSKLSLGVRARHNLALVVGPGLVVMLADTEAGSVIAAAQGGARWGYRLLLLQFALIPALFMAQELASRLGLATRQGLAELALHRLGRLPTVLLLATLTISCVGALVTQLSGLAGVGELYGVPVWQSSALAAIGLLTIVLSGNYRSVERVAMALGLCELAFVALAWQARPAGTEIASQILQIPLGDHGYLYLLAASIGTCVIPWAIFYQQSAGIDKGLTRTHLSVARVETLVGAALCQTITAAILVAAASVSGHGEASAHSFDRVSDIASTFTAVIGPTAGRVVFALGMTGGALVAAIVVCLTAAWAFGEVLGLHHSLSESPAQAPWFYGAFAAVLCSGAALVGSGVSLVRLAIAVSVLNAFLLPIVLGFLYRLARQALPDDLRLDGVYAAVVAIVFTVVGLLGLYASIVSILL